MLCSPFQAAKAKADAAAAPAKPATPVADETVSAVSLPSLVPASPAYIHIPIHLSLPLFRCPAFTFPSILACSFHCHCLATLRVFVCTFTCSYVVPHHVCLMLQRARRMSEEQGGAYASRVMGHIGLACFVHYDSVGMCSDGQGCRALLAWPL